MAPTDVESRFAQAERSIEAAERILEDVRRTMHLLAEVDVAAQRAKRRVFRLRNLVLVVAVAGVVVAVVRMRRADSEAPGRDDAPAPGPPDVQS